MASKIQSRHIYLPITPYKVETVKDEFNELNVMSAYSDYRHDFYVSIQPGWKSPFGSHGCIIMGGNNPLTASTRVCVKLSPRNSQKFIDEMHANLSKPEHIETIRRLFDSRKWEDLKACVVEVTMTGKYTIANQPAQEPQTSTPKTIETMKANELKAADLIGKTIVVGDNIATITIKSADGDTLQGEFHKEGVNPMPLPITLEKLQEQIAGGAWHLQGEQTASRTKVQPRTAKESEDAAVPDGSEHSDEAASDDPILALYNRAKAAQPDHIVLIRYKDFYAAVMDDAQPVSEACGAKPATNNGYPFTLFKSDELSAVMPKLISSGRQISIADAPAADGEAESDAQPKAKPRVQPRAAKESEEEAAPDVSGHSDNTGYSEDVVEEEEEEAEEEPKAERVQPRASKSEVTVEAEKCSPKIIDNGKSIIVAGNTSKIEAVLLTMWGRKRPYTHKGQTYSGIVLSAKHKNTVKELIKLAAAC